MQQEIVQQPTDMGIWGQSVEQLNKNPQKYLVFFQDDISNDCNTFKRSMDSEKMFGQRQSFETSLKSLLETYDEFDNRKAKNRILLEDNFEFSKIEQRSSEEQRSAKDKKSGMYSKNYRQKKKGKMKSLEEENIFLKKKIDDLQLRLRQKQMQLSRIKFSSNQQFDIQQINEQIMKKLKIISQPEASKDLIEKKDKCHETKKDNISNDKKMQQFYNFFQTYGLGGKKTKQLLQYYIHQFLQNVMRDREKYFVLKCVKGPNYKNQVLDLAVSSVFEQTQEEKKNLLKFSKIVRPTMLELTAACQEVYQSSKKVIKVLESLHGKLRVQFQQDIQITKKRLEMVMWFQTNQYRKEMRKLRADWIELVKSQKDEEQNQSLKKNKVK